MTVGPRTFSPILAGILVLWPIIAYMGAQGYTGAVGIAALLGLAYVRVTGIRVYAIACAAFVVDGGIYRHDFVASAVVDGLMRVGLDTGVPVLSVSLTPHQYQETEHHNAIYRTHFVEKGREAALAALKITGVSAALAA